jgi:hypothetical protein
LRPAHVDADSHGYTLFPSAPLSSQLPSLPACH